MSRVPTPPETDQTSPSSFKSLSFIPNGYLRRIDVLRDTCIQQHTHTHMLAAKNLSFYTITIISLYTTRPSTSINYYTYIPNPTTPSIPP